jgi:D-3-phosphoglycerate dehydrogenase
MNAQPVVIVTSTKDSPVDLEIIRSYLNNRARIRVVPLPHKKLTLMEEESFIKKMRDAVIIFQRPGFITRRVIEACPHLKFVIAHGAGVDKIDLKACAEHGVWVGNVPGENANAVAEFVVVGILALLRRLMTANAAMHRRGGWEKGRFVGQEISGGLLGIIGLGHVGRRLSQIVSGFGTRIMYYDPYLDPNKAPDIPGIICCNNLEELLKKSDYISIHVPLAKETTKFIGINEFRLMKNECIVANTSRGDVVDETALCLALSEGMIGGAVLDVFSEEPLPHSSPLRQFSNIILSPHIAGSTKECLRRIAQKACEEMLLVLSDEKPIHLVESSAAEIDLTSRA